MQPRFDAGVANGKTKNLQLRLRPELHKRVKMLCVIHDLTVQDFLEKLVVDRVHELEQGLRGKE